MHIVYIECTHMIYIVCVINAQALVLLPYQPDNRDYNSYELSWVLYGDSR